MASSDTISRENQAHIRVNRYRVAFTSLVRKEISRFLRIWIQTLLPPLVTTALYFLIFGSFVGNRVGKIDGLGYMQYIAPGLIMMSVITASYTNVSGSLFLMRFQRSIEDLIVAPIPNSLILAGFVTGGVVRGLVVGFLVVMLTLFFTHLPVAHLPVLLAIVPMTTILFSLAGFANALFARRFDDISLIPTFILTPLMYLGGVFYSIHSLPYVLERVSVFNPILYIVSSFRYGLFGVSDVSVGQSLILVSCFCLILFFLNVYLLKKGTGIRS